MTNSIEKEGLYNNIVNALNQMKDNDIRDINEINVRLQYLEERNAKMANLFDELAKVLRGC